MPTPFQHLIYAQGILHDPGLPSELKACLEAHLCAFYLGNTAADVQTLTGQPRAETHFYHLADIGALHPVEVLLTTYPKLAHPHQMEPAHAAFISGYLAHLIWDELWAAQLFIPFYVETPQWPNWRQRNLHHNALRVLLDRQAEAQLRTQPDLSACIQAVAPHHWLPFVADEALARWRDWLVVQLEDPTKVETGAVFAGRMEVSVAEFEDVITRVAQGRYAEPPPGLDAALVAFEQSAHVASLHTLRQYWKPK
jgi:hypothetical protein